MKFKNHNLYEKALRLTVPFIHTQNYPSFKRRLLNKLVGFVEIFSNKSLSIEETSSSEEIIEFFQMLKPFETPYGLTRIGGEEDGGYLIPNDLEGIVCNISPGFGGIMKFEEELFALHQIPSIIVDPIVPSKNQQGITFINGYLSAYPDDSKNFLTLDECIKFANTEEGKDAELLLQMDIEGSEYEIINSMSSATLIKFRILVIEFHNLSRIRHSWYLKSYVSTAIEKLLSLYSVVHLNVNYQSGTWRILKSEIAFPETIEVTFLRKDRSVSLLTPKKLPDPKDTFQQRSELDEKFLEIMNY